MPLEGQVRGGQSGTSSMALKGTSRAYVITRDDPLRTVVERLAVPGVRRLIVVNRHTRVVEGIVSLSDVAAYLFLASDQPPPMP